MANRKLQEILTSAEIEKTLKSVTQGVDSFEIIFEKIHQAPTATQKEKLEAELKKEIKKLQRHRDQIKAWIGSNDVKDKKNLVESRKLIELQMERFKACEKELKTKAFSKEGLLSASKLDPLEKEKAETSEWLQECIDQLTNQLDTFEFELEKLVPTTKVKKNNQANAEKSASLSAWIERHKHHIKTLEVIRRMLDNGAMELDDVKNIRDDVSFFIENNQEPEFEEDLGIYDDLNLEEADQFGIGLDDDESASSDENSNQEELEAKKKPAKEEDASPKQGKPPAKPEGNIISLVPAQKSVSTAPLKTVPKVQNTAPVPASIHTPPVQRFSTAAAAAAALSKQPETVNLPQPPPNIVSQAPPPISNSPPEQEKVILNPPKPTVIKEKTGAAIPESTKSLSSPIQSKHFSPPKEVFPELLTSSILDSLPSSLCDLGVIFRSVQEKSSKSSSEYIHLMLNSSFPYIPDISDIEIPKHYIPTTYPTPPYYPQSPVLFENPSIYEKFDVDLLFYIFYFQKCTLNQFLAARELKRQSWRFHKQYSTWFQRHEEPSSITDEYEQGAYVYFDYENWSQKKKTGFRFDYKYLEDEVE